MLTTSSVCAAWERGQKSARHTPDADAFLQTGGFVHGRLAASVLLRLAVLAALVLRMHAQQWAEALPQPLRAGAPPGCRCLLFWPPPGFDVSEPHSAHAVHILAWWQRAAAVLMRLAGLHPAVVAKWARSKRSNKGQEPSASELSEIQSGARPLRPAHAFASVQGVHGTGALSLRPWSHVPHMTGHSIDPCALVADAGLCCVLPLCMR